MILTNIKTIELRTWQTKFRGTIFIHIGVNRDDCILTDEVKNDKSFLELNKLSGVICGSVKITNCVRMTPEDSEKSKVSYNQKYYSWHLSNPKILKNPIRFKGKLGLFKVKTDIIKNNFL